MTISGTYTPARTSGDGVTKAFALNFPFFSAAEIAVSLFNTAADLYVTPAPVLNGAGTYDYTVSGVLANDGTGEYPSGTVTFNTAPPATYRVDRFRATLRTQNAALGSSGPFPAKTVEAGLDRRAMVSQERDADFARALRQPKSDTTALAELPTETARKNAGAGGILTTDPVTGQLVLSSKSKTTLETYLTDSQTVHNDRTAADASASAAAASAAAAAASASSISNISILKKTANYTVTAADVANPRVAIEVDASAGPITITFPVALGSSGSSPIAIISKIDTTANIVTINDGINNVDAIVTPATALGQIGGTRLVYSNGTNLRSMPGGG